MLYANINVPGGGGKSSASITRGKHAKEKPPKEAPPPKRDSTYHPSGDNHGRAERKTWIEV